MSYLGDVWRAGKRKVGNATSDYIIDPVRNFGDQGADAMGSLTTGVAEFVDDPTGKKADNEAKAKIARSQLEQQQAQWDEYTGLVRPYAEQGGRQTNQFLERDYTSLLPNPIDFQNDLNASDYYGPQASQYANPITGETDAQGNTYYKKYYNPSAAKYQFDPFSIEGDEGYQFTKKEGLDQLSRQGAAGSGTLGPAQQKAMAKYTTGLANQFGQQAFSNWKDTQGMNYGADRDFISQQERNAALRYGIDTDQRDWNYGANRDYIGDQRYYANNQLGVDTNMQDRDYLYENNFYDQRNANAMDQYNMEQGQAGLGQNMMAMLNPTGFMGVQNSPYQQLMSSQENGNGYWDLLNFGVKAGTMAATAFNPGAAAVV